MRFTKSFSTALIGALLATSALGELTKVIRSKGELGLSARVDKKVTGLGPDPRSKKTKDFITTYCSKPVKNDRPKPPAKKGGKRSAEQMNLKVRARPAGYKKVEVDHFAADKASDPGMWTGDIGTCVGIAVTGRSNSNAASTKFLMHLGLGNNWKHINEKFDELSAAVRGQGLHQLKGWILTVDTSLNSDPDYKNDEFMKAEAASLEKTYAPIQHYLQNLVGANPVVR